MMENIKNVRNKLLKFLFNLVLRTMSFEDKVLFLGIKLAKQIDKKTGFDRSIVGSVELWLHPSGFSVVWRKSNSKLGGVKTDIKI